MVRPLLWFDTALVAALWWFHRQGRRGGEGSRFVLLGVACVLLGVAWFLLALSDKFPPLQGPWIYRADVGVVAETPGRGA